MADMDRPQGDQADRWSKLQAENERLRAALAGLFPSDFDKHPQDFAPEWHRARGELLNIHKQGEEEEAKEIAAILDEYDLDPVADLKAALSTQKTGEG